MTIRPNEHAASVTGVQGTDAGSRGGPRPLSSFAMSIYEALVSRPATTDEDLSAEFGVSASALDVALQELVDAGLVFGSAGEAAATGWRVSPPEPVLGAVLRDMERSVREFRGRLDGLVHSYHQNRRTQFVDSPVEVVTDARQLEGLVLKLQRNAQVQLRGCDRPPYYANRSEQSALQFEVMARGVAFRSIYDRVVLDTDALVEELRAVAAAGEQARLLDGVPMKMLISDDAQAVIAVEEPDGQVRILFVHRSGFLHALIGMFETMWRLSDPLPDEATEAPSKGRQRLDQVLRLLRTGATDQAIARYLGVSHRTVERYVQQLMEELGAKSRFQAGIIAERRWPRSEKSG